MNLAVCGMCRGMGYGDRPNRLCRQCGGTGLVDDGGLLADIAKQRLEDEADERRFS